MSGVTSGTAVRAAGRAWAAIARPQQRFLSTTSPRLAAAHVVSFEKTSNPELDALLETIREKIILPSYIPFEQRKLLYKASAKKKLEAEPITLEIDGQVKRYRYMSFDEMPNTRKHFNEAVGRMQTREDFENLPKLFDGVVQQARRKLTHADRVRMVRIAGMRGCIDLVFDMARSARRTGFRLDEHELVAQLMLQLQMRAVDSGFANEETEWALRRVQLVLEMLEDDVHQPPRAKSRQERAFPLHRDPQFLAARLHMAAALVTKRHRGQDIDGQLARYASDLIAVWPENKGLMELHPDWAYVTRDELRYLVPPNARLAVASYMLHGLRLTAQVVEPELVRELEDRTELLDADIDKALSELESGEKKGLGYAIYQKLFPQTHRAPGLSMRTES